MGQYLSKKSKEIEVMGEAYAIIIKEWDNPSGVGSHWSYVQEHEPDITPGPDGIDCLRWMQRQQLIAASLIEEGWKVHTVDDEYILWTLGHPAHE